MFGSIATLGGFSACSAGATIATSSVPSAAAASACTQTLEGEIGPYFTDDSASGYNRSNILSNLDGSGTQTGVPLTLTVFVFDTQKLCAPYSGAQVDVWHCNASGLYSNETSENTSSQSWLRGYQITDTRAR
jgi:protocatechuate 3,4-dioxygenase beta subunit